MDPEKGDLVMEKKKRKFPMKLPLYLGIASIVLVLLSLVVVRFEDRFEFLREIITPGMIMFAAYLLGVVSAFVGFVLSIIGMIVLKKKKNGTKKEKAFLGVGCALCILIFVIEVTIAVWFCIMLAKGIANLLYSLPNPFSLMEDSLPKGYYE